MHALNRCVSCKKRITIHVWQAFHEKKAMEYTSVYERKFQNCFYRNLKINMPYQWRKWNMTLPVPRGGWCRRAPDVTSQGESSSNASRWTYEATPERWGGSWRRTTGPNNVRPPTVVPCTDKIVMHFAMGPMGPAGRSLKFDTVLQKNSLITNVKGSQTTRLFLTGFTLTQTRTSIHYSKLCIWNSHEKS
jgi:hypothetical protein